MSSDPMNTGGTPAARKCRTRECDNNRVPGAYYCSRCETCDPRATLGERTAALLDPNPPAEAAQGIADCRAALERRAAPVPPSLAGDAQARKAAPITDGLLRYFPNACAYVAYVSKVGNEQHNPGEPMHWAFDKSIGTGNEIARHLCEAGTTDTDGLLHTGKAAWRAFELLERELLAADPALKPGKNVKGFERK